MKTEQKYKTAILHLLDDASQPFDVEKIRAACNIGNWQTALKHCLELMIDGRISGTKTSKSWVFYCKRPRSSSLCTSSSSHPSSRGNTKNQWRI